MTTGPIRGRHVLPVKSTRLQPSVETSIHHPTSPVFTRPSEMSNFSRRRSLSLTDIPNKKVELFALKESRSVNSTLDSAGTQSVSYPLGLHSHSTSSAQVLMSDSHDMYNNLTEVSVSRNGTDSTVVDPILLQLISDYVATHPESIKETAKIAPSRSLSSTGHKAKITKLLKHTEIVLQTTEGIPPEEVASLEGNAEPFRRKIHLKAYMVGAIVRSIPLPPSQAIALLEIFGHLLDDNSPESVMRTMSGIPEELVSSFPFVYGAVAAGVSYLGRFASGRFPFKRNFEKDDRETPRIQSDVLKTLSPDNKGILVLLKMKEPEVEPFLERNLLTPPDQIFCERDNRLLIFRDVRTSKENVSRILREYGSHRDANYFEKEMDDASKENAGREAQRYHGVPEDFSGRMWQGLASKE